jgi:formylglycine-generating enzyme required for sulfatase activity
MARLAVIALLGTAVAGALALYFFRGNALRKPGLSDTAQLPVVQPASGGELALLPGGEFLMGDSSGGQDETTHLVAVSPFYMDRYLVTQELYERVMGANPSKRKSPNNPVERVQWTDAVRFCNRCSDLDGLTPCYDLQTWECNFTADGYRLPTEAEWEYACRAGSTGKYCCGDDARELVRYAWFKPHSGGMPRPVGQKAPNAWGLLDMHGNVWQWCHDYYQENYYAESPSRDPRGPTAGKQRVLRGGAWDCTAERCRAAARFQEFPVFSDACFGADSYGFRRARNGSSAGGARPTELAAKKPATDSRPPEKHQNASPSPTHAPAVREGAIDLGQLKGTIVFVSDRSGVLKIWKMPANGTRPQMLTRDSNPDADPRFSPDGGRILYTSLRGGFPEVWVMNRDGNQPQQVTKGSQGSWAPDGKSIVFIRDNQAWVRELASGTERRVTPLAWQRCGVPAWSPDGRQVAVASRHLGTIGIFILGVDGKDIMQLKTETPCCTPQWSRDGKKMLCQSVQGHIHEARIDGSDCQQMTEGADVQHDACYAPDGRFMLFSRAPTPEGPWQICVKKLDADDPDFVSLTKEGSNLMPDWHAAE